MSHIDSFKHALVGQFLGVPVYLPLEDIDGDFQCTTGQLLLGGGSGEHPAMVLKRPESAVALFLHEEVPHLGLQADAQEQWKAIYQPYLLWDFDKILKFYEWDIKAFHSFYERCTNSDYTVYKDRMSVEHWLLAGFGEFIFFSMPRLAGQIMDRLNDPYQNFHHVRYSKIVVTPPNMPVYANGGNYFFNNSE